MAMKTCKKYIFTVTGAIILGALLIAPTQTHAEWDTSSSKAGIFKKLLEKRADMAERSKHPKDGLYFRGKGTDHSETIDGRNFIVYVPDSLTKRKGDIPLLVVLHGGFGSAAQVKQYIGLDPLADTYGFLVTYLDGTQVARKLPSKLRGWNAGECCGKPQIDKIDDVSHITKVVEYIVQEYGANPNKVYGTGHSNGSMMTMRMMCETDLYKSAVGMSGPLELNVKTCPAAKGKHILAIHGQNDQNAPLEGGYGTKAINKKTNYRSQAYSKEVFENSGAIYDLLVLPNAEHSPETLNTVLLEKEGLTLPQKIVSYLGLDKSK